MSIRFCCRAASKNERGFVLISVLVIALLYFGLLELMLIESTEAMRSAQRFRSRVIAQVLAENAAELAARQIFTVPGQSVTASDEYGTMHGKLTHLQGQKFELVGRGTSSGAAPQEASVRIWGRLQGSSIRIDRTEHSQ